MGRYVSCMLLSIKNLLKDVGINIYIQVNKKFRKFEV